MIDDWDRCEWVNFTEYLIVMLLLIISSSSKSRLVLPSWFYVSGAGSPG